MSLGVFGTGIDWCASAECYVQVGPDELGVVVKPDPGNLV